MSLILGLLVGCGGDKFHKVENLPEFDKLNPKVDFEYAHSNYCAPERGVESFSQVLPRNDDDNEPYRHEGGGCIHASLTEVWNRLKAESAFDWREADPEGFSIEPSDKSLFVVHRQYEAGPRIFMNGPFRTRRAWNMDFYLYANALVPENISKSMVMYGLTFCEKDVIKKWEGRMELEAIGPTLTSFVMRNSARGMRINQTKAEGAIWDIFRNLGGVR